MGSERFCNFGIRSIVLTLKPFPLHAMEAPINEVFFFSIELWVPLVNLWEYPQVRAISLLFLQTSYSS